jgi:hypothetical protein
MAAFHLIIYGRFWVITEVSSHDPDYPSVLQVEKLSPTYGIEAAVYH